MLISVVLWNLVIIKENYATPVSLVTLNVVQLSLRRTALLAGVAGAIEPGAIVIEVGGAVEPGAVIIQLAGLVGVVEFGAITIE